ncbi:membrane protein of unknown function [Petrocella atlantisensis]|uniref:O-antigen ligase domain-containing protein n=1 Tax=Petrocella atlantisensis TaxID=2173034 RepID=A0A3P7RTJ3_9FIRM|nr:hypothetical protein [Petrocella atlantisensis]VDN46216.1 membrane protein of unknown function [Petrocella atlantisensis]
MNNEIQLKRKNPTIQKLSTFFAFYLVISNLIPQIRVIPGFYLLMFLSIFLWLFTAALAHPSFFTQFNVHKLLIFLFILYTVTVPYIFGNGTIGNRYLEHGVMLIFYLIYRYNRAYGYSNSNMLIVNFSLLSLTITSVLTLLGLFNNPYLARSIKSSGEHTMYLRSQGIGGYEFIYLLVFVSINLFFLLCNKKFIKLKARSTYIITFLFTLFLLTIVSANYFTALLMLIASFVVLLIFKNRNILAKVYILFLGVILILFRKNIFDFLIKGIIKLMGSGATVEKLLKLQESSSIYYGSDSIFSDRASTIISSWLSFLENPISGLVISPIQSSGGFLTGFGQHSHFVDTLALYGLFIGVLNIYIILYPFFIRFDKKRELFSLNLSMLISVLIIFSFNNVTPSIGFGIFFVYPVFYDWVMELKNNNI